MSFQTVKLEESDNNPKKVYLDNEQVSIREFNSKLESLRKNQRIVESSEDNFHVVERLYN